MISISILACIAGVSTQTRITEINNTTNSWDLWITVSICVAVILGLAIIIYGKYGRDKEYKETEESSVNINSRIDFRNDDSKSKQTDRELEKQRHENAIDEMNRKALIEREAAEDDFKRVEALFEKAQKLKASGLDVKINLFRGPYKIEICSSTESVESDKTSEHK